jgi:hypothetical protein
MKAVNSSKTLVLYTNLRPKRYYIKERRNRCNASRSLRSTLLGHEQVITRGLRGTSVLNEDN